jgi:hypothetical protein
MTRAANVVVARVLFGLTWSAGLLVVGCGPWRSAELPSKGDCLSDLHTHGGGPQLAPTLNGYRIVPCDSNDAEFQVMNALLGHRDREPEPCPADMRTVVIREQGELYEVASGVCLAPAP